MKIYIIAGEASGDMHAANLVAALRNQHDDLEIRGWGGDLMEAQGVTLVKHIRELAFMGFAEVVMNLKTILGNIGLCKRDISRFAPDAIIFVDYPGFNLRIASFAKSAGIHTLYYISPQVWAWKKGRVHDIKKHIDRMYVILPFEQDWYAEYNYSVEYVGHPLLDELARKKYQLPQESDLIAILPGSRKQEIDKMLPVMLQIRDDFKHMRLVIAAAPALDDAAYAPYLREGISIERGDTYGLLSRARVAVVTSGTATLESALINTPQVVCYKSSAASYAIAKRLVSLKYISLVNLIMDAPIVTELIQGEMNATRITECIRPLLNDGPERENMVKAYARLREILGGQGASQRCAKSMLKTMAKRT